MRQGSRIQHRIRQAVCAAFQCVGTVDSSTASKESAALTSFRGPIPGKKGRKSLRSEGGVVRLYTTTCTGRGEDEQLNDALMLCSSGERGGLMNAGS